MAKTFYQQDIQLGFELALKLWFYYLYRASSNSHSLNVSMLYYYYFFFFKSNMRPWTSKVYIYHISWISKISPYFCRNGYPVAVQYRLHFIITILQKIFKLDLKKVASAISFSFLPFLLYIYIYI